VQTAEHEVPEVAPVQFLEFMGVSWVFVAIHTFYSFGSSFIGVIFLEDIQNRFPDLSATFLEGFSAQKVFYIASLFSLICFPLVAWLYVKIWGNVISFFSSLFGNDDRSDECMEVSTVALAGNALLVVPVFGTYLKTIAGFVFLYAGMRTRLQFTKAQAIITLISPMFLLFLLMMLISFYFFLLFVS
jgi:ABC-type multidrug transport system fused ATPase/permease subunit